MNGTFNLEVYNKSGMMLSSGEVDISAQRFSKLRMIIGEKKGWRRSVTSYVTPKYVLRGEGIIIGCFSNRMVIDSHTSKGSTSWEKDVDGLHAFLE